MRKIFNWELKLEIIPLKQVLEEQKSEQLKYHLEEKDQKSKCEVVD